VVLLNGDKVITAEMLAAKLGKKVDNDVPKYCNSLNFNENLLPRIALTSDNIIRPFEEIEKEAILKTIEYCNGNVVKAAKLLKMVKAAKLLKIRRNNGRVANNVSNTDSVLWNFPSYGHIFPRYGKTPV